MGSKKSHWIRVMGKTFSRALAWGLTSILMVSCGMAPPGDSASGEVMRPADVSETALVEPMDQDAAAQQAAEGANAFAFRFSKALLDAESQPEANFVCSPYSVWLPLAALVNATKEDEREQLLEALSEAGLTAEQLNLAASRMLYDLTAVRENAWKEEEGLATHDPLQIANAIFVDNTAELDPAFAQVFADFYRGSCMNVDFSSDEAAREVNQWAAEHTDGLIDNVIDRFDPQTVSAIANAIYFSDRWHWEFDETQTKEDTFHAPSGDAQAYFMVHEGENQRYYEDEQLQAMPLRFATGGGMLILLPKDGQAGDLLQDLTAQRFSDIMGGTDARSGKLLLPRFELASDGMSLLSSLEALGVPLMDPMDPALTGLLKTGDPLYISQAVQSAKIKVDEKGTTAAAVTVLAESGAALPEPTEPFEMNCNSPFVFVLYGDTYDGGHQVLFTGVVNDPQ